MEEPADLTAGAQRAAGIDPGAGRTIGSPAGSRTPPGRRPGGATGGDGGASQLATVTGSVAAGYTVSLPVAVDTRTTPTAGGGPGGGASPSR